MPNPRPELVYAIRTGQIENPTKYLMDNDVLGWAMGAYDSFLTELTLRR